MMTILKWPFIILVRVYQVALSPFLPPACRFYPTCSNYCLDALKQLPLHKALFYALRRILRCHPWGGHGLDPVPEQKS